jgi:two-component system sensor kinase FixL
MSIDGLSSEDFKHLKSAIDEAAIVAITDERGQITYVNEKFCAISQYSRSELIGKTHRLINSGLHSKEFFLGMWNTISSGKTWEGEIRNRAKDGSSYWVHTTIVPFLDENFKPIRYVAVRYDITNRILAEEKLKIEARKLEASNRELQDFASVAAHDLQEPLRKIQSFADRLRVVAKESVSAEVVDYLERIQKSAFRMQVLINDLLSYSRLSTKLQTFVPTDLGSVLHQVLADLDLRIESTQAQIRMEPLPVIEADPSQMHQLFSNLISNALKFHKPGVTPVVEVSARKITGPSGHDQHYEICVADNGIGFEEKYLDRIFTIFQRLHGRHQYEGTGIGLAICKKIVERHGGVLTAKSQPGEGATFILTVPMHEKREQQRA